MKEPRKHTRFEFCDRHAPWFAGQPRYRKIECMVEGGPGGWSPGCEGGTCRLWPGRDIFEASVCSGELEIEWTRPEEVDQAAELRAADRRAAESDYPTDYYARLASDAV